jgi:hypothetical protein
MVPKKQWVRVDSGVSIVAVKQEIAIWSAKLVFKLRRPSLDVSTWCCDVTGKTDDELMFYTSLEETTLQLLGGTVPVVGWLEWQLERTKRN